MRAIQTTANFNENGGIEIDNLPLIKNQKVELLILLEENEKIEWNRFSGENLSNAYSNEEPEYELSMLKEPNPDISNEGGTDYFNSFAAISLEN